MYKHLKKIIIVLSFFMILAGVLSCSNIVHHNDLSALYIHLASEPGTLNPITSTEAVATSINNHIYETLVDRDFDTLEIIPQLAERWTISKDKKKYTFYLKKGVLWSDGVEFTADDVVYSFKTLKDPKTACAPLKVYYIDVKNIRRVNKYTVEFSYSKPYFLALEFCGGIPIVPKHIFNDGSDFNTHKNGRFPIGTGPYKFDKWVTGKKIVLSVNEKYRGNIPDIKKVVYRIVSEPNVALQMLKKGDLDLMSLRAIQWVRQSNSEKFNSRFYKLKYYNPSYSYIGWNARRPFFRDKLVRRALTHFVNRRAILDKLLFGLGKIVTGNFYVFSDYYDKNIQQIPFDVKRGKELLKLAGWEDTDGDGILDRNGEKFSFTFTIPSGSKFGERLSSILKEDFSNVGIEMDINRYEWAVFVQKLHKRDFDAVVLSWNLGYGGDPYQLWHSSQVDKGSNFCSFNNSKADILIEKARVEFNKSRRTGMYRRFHRIIHEYQPYTFLYCSPALVAVSKRFDNVNVHLRGLNYHEWKIRDHK